MNETAGETADLDAFIAAGTRLLGLRIRPEWHDAIRLHLGVSLAHARAVGDFPLADESEPASVFTA